MISRYSLNLGNLLVNNTGRHDQYNYGDSFQMMHDGEVRDTKWAWCAPVGADIGWQDTRVFGQVKLQPDD